MTLRQEIEKILCRGCGIPEKERHCDTCCSMPEKLNAVCEAIGKTAEGMGQIRNPYSKKGQVIGFNQAKIECQAYFKKETGK